MSDEPRFLARGVRRPSKFVDERGYTTRADLAMYCEPEAVSMDVQDDITARSRRSEREAQVLHWRERREKIEKEIDWLYSQRFQRDVSKALRTLRRQLDRIDKLIAAS